MQCITLSSSSVLWIESDCWSTQAVVRHCCLCTLSISLYASAWHHDDLLHLIIEKAQAGETCIKHLLAYVGINYLDI